jgi:hypothetical protein
MELKESIVSAFPGLKSGVTKLIVPNGTALFTFVYPKYRAGSYS